MNTETELGANAANPLLVGYTKRIESEVNYLNELATTLEYHADRLFGSMPQDVEPKPDSPDIPSPIINQLEAALHQLEIVRHRLGDAVQRNTTLA